MDVCPQTVPQDLLCLCLGAEPGEYAATPVTSTHGQRRRGRLTSCPTSAHTAFDSLADVEKGHIQTRWEGIQ